MHGDPWLGLGDGHRAGQNRQRYAAHDVELHLRRTAVDMNTTLQAIALDVMPQQDDGILVVEHPLGRSAS